MINERENGYFSVGLCERSLGTELSTDFILPDYQSEIRRVLNVSATPLPPAMYVGADTVEFNGTVDYQLLYVGGDGGVYTAPLSGEYSFNVPYERGECEAGDLGVLCTVVPEAVSARVSAPRKLSIRCRLRPNVRIYGKRRAETAIMSEVDPTSVYTRDMTCECLVSDSGVSDTITLNTSLALHADDVRVVSADTRILIENSEYSQDGMMCRGRVALKLLCVSEGSGEYSTLTKDIPFEGGLDVSLGAPDGLCRARGVLSEMSVSVNEASAECSMGILLEAVVEKNQEVVYTSDIYSTKNECECRVSEVSARRVLACQNANFTLSERVPLANAGVPEDAQLIDTLGTVCFERCEAIDGRQVFSGNAEFCVIYKKDTEVYSNTLKLPVKYEMQSSGTPVAFDCTGEATDIRARIEQGELRIDAELMLSMDSIGESVAEMVESVRFGDAIENGECELIVCYPSADDTLWSVAKRYKVAPSDVLGNPEEDKYVIIE